MMDIFYAVALGFPHPCIFQKYLSTFFFIYPHTKGLPSEASSECMAD